MSLKVHYVNGLMKGKSYSLCLRVGLPVTDDKNLVSCWTCSKRVDETESLAKAIGMPGLIRKPKRPSIYGPDGRVNV